MFCSVVRSIDVLRHDIHSIESIRSTMYVDIIAKNERASLEIRVTQFGVVWYIITVYGVSV